MLCSAPKPWCDKYWRKKGKGSRGDKDSRKEKKAEKGKVRKRRRRKRKKGELRGKRGKEYEYWIGEKNKGKKVNEKEGKERQGCIFYFCQKYDLLVGWGEKNEDLLRKKANIRGRGGKTGKRDIFAIFRGENQIFWAIHTTLKKDDRRRKER